jgi:hypothetical protein
MGVVKGPHSFLHDPNPCVAVTKKTQSNPLIDGFFSKLSREASGAEEN